MWRRTLLFGTAALGFCARAAPAPQRIVSISPTVTDLLYGIGAFPQVVAVTEYCTYPPEAKALPKVGGWATPSVEKVASFRPDLVAIADAQAPFLEKQLAQLGIRTVIVRSQTVEDAFTAIDALGKATGKEREAANLVAQTRTSLETVRKRAARLPHPTVLCIVDRTPGTLRDLYAVTEGSYLAELIAIAGGKVIGAPARGGYARINKETLLTENPDFVLDLMTNDKSSGNPADAWRELPELNAVRRGNIRIVRDDYVPHDSQRIAWTAVLFAKLLHPEVPPREWDAR
jgi:iron complex transport system substrate-binding protein